MLEDKEPYFKTLKGKKRDDTILEAETKLKEAMDSFCFEHKLKGVSTTYCFTKIYNHIKGKQTSGNKRKVIE